LNAATDRILAGFYALWNGNWAIAKPPYISSRNLKLCNNVEANHHL
jgi:hypothetical protein